MTPTPVPLTQCKSIDNGGFAALTKDAYIMEPKIDGWRMQVDVTPFSVQAWTRTNHDATGKMLLAEEVLQHIAKRVGKNFRLDGEAVVMDENGQPDYNLTSRFLGSGVDVCRAKQAERELYITYYVFDILAEDSTDLRDLPLTERKAVLEMLGYYTEGPVEVVVGTEPSYDQHAKNFEEFKEGSVLKLRKSSYEGKRHKSWLKLKEVETVDVRVTGFKPGQGKYEGMIGAIEFYDPATKVVGYCSGMDDAMREVISKDPEFFLHTTIEIKHFGKLVDGYRHPQFIRFRQDKAI